jgi:hypothetical protein
MRYTRFIPILLLPILLACRFTITPIQIMNWNTAPNIEQIVARYKNWTLLTPSPHNVSEMLAGLCRAPTQLDDALGQSVHANVFLKVYMNPLGVSELSRATPVFPVGTVIVKDKLPTADGADSEALGIMIKREKGFNPAGGDWEYVYRAQDGNVMRGPSSYRTASRAISPTKIPTLWPSFMLTVLPSTRVSR